MSAQISDLEKNKATILKFFDEAEHNGIVRALDLVADDATWWVLGRPPLEGTYTKPEITRVLLKVMESIEGGWKFNIKAVTAEDDRVAVESENEAKLRNDTIYHGYYHCLFTVRDGRIRQIKEYLDTQYVHELYVKPFLTAKS